MGADISADFPLPKYRPYFNFVYKNIEKLNEDRLFSKVRLVPICVGLIVAWRGTKTVERHVFQPTSQYCLPQILYNQYFSDLGLPTQHKVEEERKALAEFQKKIQFSFNVLYPISQVAFSEGKSHLSCFLNDHFSHRFFCRKAAISSPSG